MFPFVLELHHPDISTVSSLSAGSVINIHQDLTLPPATARLNRIISSESRTKTYQTQRCSIHIFFSFYAPLQSLFTLLFSSSLVTDRLVTT
ncbi:hypothetical protein I7I50_06831 [Histoplasma capsulatum G186AR]|uniref:Uncharacterized protein n=1 Tax=Ajellomyces capsulatus TaxID=5037 RepID=A0A8H7Z0Q6_AJECA|nr:hypothetical protein I7I52_10095 [Histoplasma capsulatum]QSS67677.1 hypothetical protein I7I50_06831 [Histoplasma capsulatum G186AR]